MGVASLSTLVTAEEMGQGRFEVSTAESAVLLLVVAVHGIAGVVGLLQLVCRSTRCRSLLWPVALMAVLCDTTLLGLRAVAIGAVPLTGTCEACVFLAVVLGVLYLLIGPMIDRVWFGSVMVWISAGLVGMAVALARPAAPAQAVASTPWAVAHAAVMVLAAAAVMFAAANSTLYLLGSHRLKRKKVMQVLGRIPNMETLGDMNRVGLLAGFVLLTVGLVSGLGLISTLGMGMASWAADGKVICMLAIWCLLGVVLVLDRFSMLREKGRACVTLVAFVLVLFAILGVAVTGVTQHEFSLLLPSATPLVRV
ncbi:MAG: cytochrome c biogenesis protein CcsA [Phycisphaerales bacterium]|nr:MAG: cytochrome c biogenesis protein CcsA [Phycisphaerales bacterium]